MYPLGSQQKIGGMLSLGKWGEFTRGWARCRDTMKNGAGFQVWRNEGRSQVQESGDQKNYGFLSQCQLDHHDTTKREVGGNSTLLTFLLPWDLLLVFPIAQTHLEVRRQKPSWFIRVALPSTELGILGLSIFIHWDFDFYRSSKGQILSRSGNTHLPMDVSFLFK